MAQIHDIVDAADYNEHLDAYYDHQSKEMVDELDELLSLQDAHVEAYYEHEINLDMESEFEDTEPEAHEAHVLAFDDYQEELGWLEHETTLAPAERRTLH